MQSPHIVIEKIKGSMTEHEPESLIKVDKEIKVVEKYCTTCGRKMTIDAGFCPSCGIAQNTIN